MMINYLLQIILILVSVAFFTLLERKVLGYIQNRKGPNKPFILGLAVPFADAIKLANKELNYPALSNGALFVLSPLLVLTLPMMLWAMYPSQSEYLVLSVSVVMFICISSMSVYGTMLTGWSSNSKYSMLGSIRSVAQSISYEVSLSVIILHFLMISMFNINHYTDVSLMLLLPYTYLLFNISMLAETNRSPFDFAEGESELVSGFNTEYSSVTFVMIFLAEYMSIIFMSLMSSILFMSSSYLEIMMMTGILGFFFIWVRGTMPRYRYDQLMYLAWKGILPVVLSSLCFFIVILL